MSFENINVLYRVEVREDLFDQEEFFVEIMEYPVEKHTACGVWIKVSPYSEKKRFVNLTYRKKWACPTIEEAFESMYRRKKAQVGILAGSLSKALRLLNIFSDPTNVLRECRTPGIPGKVYSSKECSEDIEKIFSIVDKAVDREAVKWISFREKNPGLFNK